VVPTGEPIEAGVGSGLSPREREIARMVAKGYTNKTIAAVLEISSWTVDTHIRRIFGKVGVRSRSAMVAQLAATGVVGVEDDSTPDWQTAWRRDREPTKAARPKASARPAVRHRPS
jgi:DNA-binding CsgD family transcriptional regulator